MSEMHITVILRLPTGEEYTVSDHYNWPDEVHEVTEDEKIQSTEYLWTDGNLGCDCNKRIYLNRQHGLPLTENNPCGDTIELTHLNVNGRDIIL